MPIMQTAASLRSPDLSDELTFDRVIDALPQDTRDAVLRVVNSGRASASRTYTSSELDDAHEEGYEQGVEEGKRLAREEKKAS